MKPLVMNDGEVVSSSGERARLRKSSSRCTNSDNAPKAQHPCFSCGACATSARIHLPVAPHCNISCNYCLRKFDCPNESRPGVTTAVLSPVEALERFKRVRAKMPNLSVVGIAGPGDTLANFDRVSATLRLIREIDKDVLFCLSTNGLMLPKYANELLALGVSHVTITINAVDSKVGAGVYKFIDHQGKRYHGEEAAKLLLENQLRGLSFLASKGVLVKVNIVMLKGINEHHIADVVRTVRGLGAELTNIMQLIPVAGSPFENMPLVSAKELQAKRKECERYIRQMYHCKQCRADAVGLLGHDESIRFREEKLEASHSSVRATTGIKVAVASRTGVVVDQHFGQAEQFYIYESDGVNLEFVGVRPVSKYCHGPELCAGEPTGTVASASDSGEEESLGGALSAVSDCNAVLSLRMGEAPKQRLSALGVVTIATYERIDKAVKMAARMLA